MRPVRTIISGRYELLEILFSHGLACVFLARDHEDSSEVAVKHLHGDSDGRGCALLLREAQILSQLTQRTAGVAAYRDIVHEQGDVYLITERVHGAFLSDWQQGRCQRTILALYTRIASVLHEIHEAGFVHRDMKPAYVMVADRDGDAQVKIIDMELTVKLGEPDPLTGVGLVGTPLYMSPEMLEGKPVTTASDVFALGVMLFEAITGRWPWSADRDILGALNARLVSSPALGEFEGSELGALMGSMLDMEPDTRPSAHAVAHALAALAGDEGDARSIDRVV